MEHLRITRVDNVMLMKGKKAFLGTLHLTAHHLIFRYDTEEELWVFYSMIHHTHRHLANLHNQITLDLHCRNFLFIRLLLSNESQANDVYESLNKLIHISSLEQLYAFIYWPSVRFEVDGWALYDAAREHARQLAASPAASQAQWRRTALNESYALCATYPSTLHVPLRVSDSVLKYAVKHRSKMRLPVLTYLHTTGATLTRCAQPLVGVKNNRSLQDEKLVETIFAMPVRRGSPACEHLIVDARPAANAMANTAKGAGTENMEYYKGARKVFMGIDNIHVMRESLSKMMEALNQSVIEGRSPQLAQLEKSNWLYHLKMLLDATYVMVETLDTQQAHVLIHCSDGWDRTAQLVSLCQVCLDPYFRTLEGFLVLIDKDWLSFGHKFSDRSGHFSTEHAPPGAGTLQKMQQRYYQSLEQREISPVFHQFLDAVFQLLWQHPTSFEFNARLLADLQFHVYSCQFGTFLLNCERERAPLRARTHALWSHLLAHRGKYTAHAHADVLRTGVLAHRLTRFRYWTAGIGELAEEALVVEMQPAAQTSPPTQAQPPSGPPGSDAGADTGAEDDTTFFPQEVVEKVSSLWSRWSRFGSISSGTSSANGGGTGGEKPPAGPPKPATPVEDEDAMPPLEACLQGIQLKPSAILPATTSPPAPETAATTAPSSPPSQPQERVDMLPPSENQYIKAPTT